MPRKLVYAAVVLTAASLCACEGGGGGAGALPPTAKTVASGVRVTLSILVPRAILHRIRRPQFVSASTQSLSIAVGSATPILLNIGPSAPGCQSAAAGYTCGTALNVAPGRATFLMTAYDKSGGTGKILSTGSVTQTIDAGAANTVSIALDGVVAKVALAFQQSASPTEGAAATLPLTVMAQDADGNTIVGPGAYDRPIELTDGDPLGTTKLSTTTVTGPDTAVMLAYNGKPLSSAGANSFITASVANVAPAAISGAYFATNQTDWATWGNAASRGSSNLAETTLTSSAAGGLGGLHQIWSTTLSGILNAQAVVAANVSVAGAGPVDVLYEGDERGAFYALNAGTGAVIWKNQLGTQSINFSDPNQAGCTDQPGGVYGIGSTAQIDRADGLVFVADGQGVVFGFDLATGNQVKKFASAFLGPDFNHIYSGLTLDSKNGLLYVPVGAKCGLLNDGAIVQYDVKSGAQHAYFPGGGTRAGVWGPGGVPLDPTGATSDIFLATADGPQALFPQSPAGPFGASVVRLNSAFSVVGYNTPVNVGPGIADYDFGGTPLVFVPTRGGCSSPLLVAGNKDGELFIYYANDITRSGNGAFQRMQLGAAGQQTGVNLPSPAFDPASGRVFINNGSDSPDGQYPHGLLAFDVNAACNLSLAWNAAVGPNSTADGPPAPPTVANGVVYYADGPGNISCSSVGSTSPTCTTGLSDLYAFSTGSGNQIARVSLKGPLFAAPTVVNGHVYLASWHGYGPGVVYALGL